VSLGLLVIEVVIQADGTLQYAYHAHSRSSGSLHFGRFLLQVTARHTNVMVLYSVLETLELWPASSMASTIAMAPR
jgi:hypothetical protein